MAEYNYKEKTGEWNHEPNFAMFTDDESGFTCVILRITKAGFGYLCGYVIIPEHLREKIAGSSFEEFEVHGEVTFNDYLNSIEIEGKKVYAVGFDCAHAGDLIPAMEMPCGVYRNIEFVKAECRKLARQIKEIMIGGKR